MISAGPLLVPMKSTQPSKSDVPWKVKAPLNFFEILIKVI